MKRIPILVFLLAICFASYGQNTPHKYRGIYLGFGPRVLNADPGTIVLDFVDDSPSMDNIQTITDVKDSYLSVGVQLGFEWGRYNGLSYDFDIDIATGGNTNGVINFSMGYTKSFESNDRILLIRPAIMAGFANYGFDLGDLENNAAYIQIGDRQFTGSHLDAKVRSQVTLWGPQLDAIYTLFPDVAVYFKAAYDVASANDRAKIEFQNPNDGSGFAEIDLNSNTANPDVQYNGTKLIDLPYDASGLRMAVGVVYVWNKDKD